MGNSLTQFIYDHDNLIAEITDSQLSALYLYGPGVDEPIAMVRDLNKDLDFSENEIFYYVKDHLNSVYLLTDKNAIPVQRYSYTAYGKTKVEKLNESSKLIKNPFAFTSREWDEEFDLYNFRARYYSPNIGRFIQEDPIGWKAGNGNFYNYVSNNPINFSDPSGLKTEICSAPFQPFEGSDITFNHHFVCVTTSKGTTCGGTSAEGNPLRLILGGVEGQRTYDERPDPKGGGFEGSSSHSGGQGCKTVPPPPKAEDCMDKCIENALNSTNRPQYSLANLAGSNCKAYAEGLVSSCMNSCVLR